MLAITSPAPMQGSSFFRNTPTTRFTSSLLATVTRRITGGSGNGKIYCSDRSISTESINPSNCPSPPSPPPPSFPAHRSTTDAGARGEESRGRSALAPLPSSSFRNDAAARRWGRGDRESSFLDDWGFRSAGGSRSEPSQSSIPGKFSKYSKPVSKLHTATAEKREVKRDKKAFRKPMGDIAAERYQNVAPSREDESSSSSTASESTPRTSGADAGTEAGAEAATGAGARKAKGKKGPLSEDQFPDWMKDYQFSYSEVPSVPIVGFRETPWSPFGPPDMVARPWTGRAPLQPSKKKRPEFDSFNPPPLGKKGVKYVQRPGPFPPGHGPKPGKTREKILGEPLTSVEIHELINGVNKGSKQLNLGRDGLTHNMLDVIHSHWKRSVVCKIKCKGVPTVDMENVARIVEEKTGGAIIHRVGGVIYLFRGRNYNYKDRPQIPIMLWKPPDPIYPRLIQPIPEGLTLEEAKNLRAKGRKIAPMCKLAKNGVYLNLVADVRAQFQVDDLVKVDCEGMHATDYKKIGAKLKDLVPCTLLSFEKEQIIMCRKRTVVDEKDGLDDLGADGESFDDGEGTGIATGSGGGLSTDQSVPVVEDQHIGEHLAKEEEDDDAHLEVVSGVVDDNSENTVPLVTESSPVSAATASVPADVNFKEDAANSRGEVSISDRGSIRDKSPSPVMDGGGNIESAVNVHAERSDSQSDMMSKRRRATRGALALNDDDDDDDAFRLTMGDAEDVLSTAPSRNVEVGSSSGYDGMRGEDQTLLSEGGGTTEGKATVSRVDEDDNMEEEEEEDVAVDALWEKAIEEGKALELDEQHADSDHVYRAASELFSGDLEPPPVDSSSSSSKEGFEKGEQEQDSRQDSSKRTSSRRVPQSSPFQAPPMGRLGVDELAKLLAP